ncbi:MAG: hypothetical protein EBS77_09860 [Gammaproteobacteria bacterium]|nr:hypothetical protein [Gammaproteobacteria bacterium]
MSHRVTRAAAAGADAALVEFNSLLQSASDQIGLGISNIDLDYDGDWGNAMADMDARDYDDDLY